MLNKCFLKVLGITSKPLETKYIPHSQLKSRNQYASRVPKTNHLPLDIKSLKKIYTNTFLQMTNITRALLETKTIVSTLLDNETLDLTKFGTGTVTNL